MKKERLDKFSIRKLTVGAASVLIGVAFGATTVSAEKQPTPQAQAAGQQAAQVTELKDVNCKVRLLDDAGKYTNDYVVTDTTVKALASKVVNGVTFYKVAENRWIPAKFAEVLSDKEVAFKGVAKTFVKGHANYAVAMLDADGKYTGKFLKQGSSFKVFAKKVINGHLCYRLGTQAQWVPARFLVF